MGAEVAALCDASQALRAQARGGPIPHEGVKEGALLYIYHIKTPELNT